jgi:N-formylglutamate deformylase
MEVFTWIEPTAPELPVVLSIPHAGTFIPEPIRHELKPEMLERLDDTDWFVDRLYAFAPALGIPVLVANCHRWVIDLNRAPDQKPLYADGRVITGLCPTTDFTGAPIYRDGRLHVHPSEISNRTDRYFHPYHRALQSRLIAASSKFGSVLLWDCHSIRSVVPAIHPQPFPQLILGSADGTSASPGLIETALRHLEQSGRPVAHNFPFKGGYITRTYGRPAAGIHALQLEMTKTNYMDDSETRYDDARAERIIPTLKQTLLALADMLGRFG